MGRNVSTGGPAEVIRDYVDALNWLRDAEAEFQSAQATVAQAEKELHKQTANLQKSMAPMGLAVGDIVEIDDSIFHIIRGDDGQVGLRLQRRIKLHVESKDKPEG